ncbi:MAG: hypothetical protein AAF125_28010 [Chloroflexota bacterium]
MTTQTKQKTDLIPQQNLLQRLRNVALSREGVLFLITLAAMAILSSQNENFLTSRNLLNQLRLLTEVGLVALPMTYIIITAGIDLSVGSIFGLAAIASGSGNPRICQE